MHFKKIPSPTLVLLLILITRVSTHCRYDMNLEYLEIMNIQSSFKSSLPAKLNELQEEDRFRISDKEEFFVEVVSKDMSLTNYAKNFLIKKNIVKKNIERMIANNCQRIYDPIEYGTVLGDGFFGQVETFDLMSSLDQVAGHWPSHVAQSDKTYACHVDSPC